MVVNNVNLDGVGGGGGVVWVASPRHPSFKTAHRKKIYVIRGKTNGNTWVEKTL